jgi:hypothetical protein
MKKVSLNKNSWHYKLYDWITKGDTPKTLCPYFWMMVGIILLLPILVLFKLTSQFIDYCIGKTKEVKINDNTKNNLKKFGKFLEISGKILLGAWLFLSLVFLILLLYKLASNVGWYTMFKNLLSIIGVILITKEIIVSKLLKKFFNLKIFQILKSMAISIYTKSCPLIEWNENK